MRTFWNKKTIIALLSGMMFFCGGILMANAAPGDTIAAQQPVSGASGTGSYRSDRNYWAYTWRIPPGIIGTIGNKVTGAGDQPPQYAVSVSEATCLSEYTNNTAGNILLSPCTQYTGAELNTLTAQASIANRQFTDRADLVTNAIKNPYDLKCWTALPPSVDVGGCIALISYYVYIPTGFLVMAGGALFDSVLVLSIDPTWINQGFINTAWEILRDFANMAFIFILLYIGISTMLLGESWQRPVINVIIVAIFINFSLFATKIIIDAGNILAVGIYEQMGSPQQNHLPCPSSTSTCVTERDVSGNIASAVQLQKILSPDVANSLTDKGPLTFVFLAGAAMNIMLFWIFFRVSYLFIARLIKFWELLIVSPVAFLSTAIPRMSGFANEWLNTLIKQTFLAPVFLFYMYVILTIFDSGFFSSWLNPSSVGEKGYSGILLSVFLSGIIVFVALTKALDLAESFSGTAGETAKKYIGGALGFGAGKVIGGAAWAKRMTTGKAAGEQYKREEATLRDKIAKGGVGGWRAQQQLDKLDKLRSSSFDLRENKTVSTALGGLGLSGMGEASKGGYKAEKDKKKENEKRIREIQRNKENKEKIPDLENKLSTLKREYAQLSRDNGDTIDPQTGKITNRGTTLKQNVVSEESRLKVADAQVAANPGDPIAAANHLRALHQRNSAAEKLKKYDDAEDKIEKLDKQIEEYKNL